jgi:hypothetical protein
VGAFFRADGAFLDYGGGTGMLVRMMRDKGFDFNWLDAHGENQFAQGFEASEGASYELVTAFEVFEHFPDPLASVREVMSFSKNILFSTNLLPRSHPLPGDWWYYALDSGQHVSIFTKRSLQLLGTRLGLQYCTNGISMHMLTPKPVSQAVFGIVTLPPVAAVLGPLLGIGRRSLLADDYFRLTGRSLR